MKHPKGYTGREYVSTLSVAIGHKTTSFVIVVCGKAQQMIKYLDLTYMVENGDRYDVDLIMSTLDTWWVESAETPPQVYLGIREVHYKGLLSYGAFRTGILTGYVPKEKKQPRMKKASNEKLRRKYENQNINIEDITTDWRDDFINNYSKERW